MKEDIIKKIKNGEKFKVRCIKDYRLHIFGIPTGCWFNKNKTYEIQRIDDKTSNVIIDNIIWIIPNNKISDNCRFSGFIKNEVRNGNK